MKLKYKKWRKKEQEEWNMQQEYDLVLRLRSMQKKYGDISAYAIVLKYFENCDYTDFEYVQLTKKLLEVENKIGTSMITFQNICKILSRIVKEKEEQLLTLSSEKIAEYVSEF